MVYIRKIPQNGFLSNWHARATILPVIIKRTKVGENTWGGVIIG